jgi:hypothetical protein
VRLLISKENFYRKFKERCMCDMRVRQNLPIQTFNDRFFNWLPRSVIGAASINAYKNRIDQEWTCPTCAIEATSGQWIKARFCIILLMYVIEVYKNIEDHLHRARSTRAWMHAVGPTYTFLHVEFNPRVFSLYLPAYLMHSMGSAQISSTYRPYF